MADGEEILDIYDGERKMLGYTKRRGEPLNDGEFIVAVGIWIVDGNGKLLITKRSMQKRYAPGKWENTGGHLKHGEEPVAAVIRELYEETGIKVAREDVRFLGTSKAAPFFGDNFIAFVNDTSGIKLQPGETSDARWVSLNELEQMMQSGDMALSTVEHMKSYKDAFYAAIADITRGNIGG